MPVHDDYERLAVASRAEWRAWLAAHHEHSPGVWTVTWKKAGGGPHVPYADLVEEALCFGWIDSVRRRVDDGRTRLLFTPRRRGSHWARTNKERVGRLTAAGLMAPAGLAAVERARADGGWTALDAVEDLVEPDDLRDALDATPDARRHWDAFPASTRRGILWWITSAKRPATRARRVEETATMAARNLRANQLRQPRGNR